MTVFPTPSHLVSWTRWSPQVKQSAGKRKGSNATGRGNPYLSAALGEVSISAGRTQSFLGARYRRLAKRMPKKKALVATGNSALTIIHALLSGPAARYTDLGPDYYEQCMHVREVGALLIFESYPFGPVDVERIQEVADAMRQFGLIPDSFDVHGMIG